MEILRTKLNRPRFGEDILSRPHLLKVLEKSLNLPLTLISAPAGYGKSTLASQWLEECNFPSAWLSLDPTTDNLHTFLTYFITAIQRVFPEACQKTNALLKAPNLPPLPVLSTSLINELDDIDQDFVLVLDDYHHIQEQAVHALLSELLRNPPRPMHVILLTRRDPPLPLVNLRAQQKMAEIRLQGLRFTRDETAAFLEHLLEKHIEQAIAAAWTERTEGWVTGLRLAALSMRHRGDIDSLTLETRGSVQYVTEYLFSEVLSQVPSHVRQYLLSITVLDLFCAPLIEALCEGDVESGEKELSPWDFIKFLQEENIFIIRLDAENRWFRFHHLFRQLLENQLKRYRSPEEIARLHSRASVWFAENDWIEEAIRHALKAGDTLYAAQIVERNRQAILNEDKWHSLEKWLTIIPEEIKQESVELLLAQGWVCLHRLALQALPSILEKIDKAASKETMDTPSRGEIDFFRGYACYLQGQGLQSEEYLRKALEEIPETYYLARGQAIVYHALALQMIGRKEMAIQGLNDKLRASRSSKGIAITRLFGALGFIHLLDCNLSQSLVAMQGAQEIASRHNLFYAESWALYVEALIHFLRNELDDALQGFSRILENPYIVHTGVAVDSFCALAQIHQIRQQPEKAQEILKLLLGFAAQTDNQSFIAISSSCKAHLSMLRGDMAQALLWLRSAALTPDASIMLFWVEVPRITECRVLIAEGSDASLQEALDKLHKYEHENKAFHNTIQQIGILALMALAYKKQGNIDEALATLGHAIELAEPGRVIRPFIEPGPQMADLLKQLIKQNVATNFVGQILTAFRKEHLGDAYPASSSAQPLVDPLTKREMEILTLLAKRERSKEIAETLFISSGTVKRHISNIYQKLGVNNRKQAVAKAEALGILSSK